MSEENHFTIEWIDAEREPKVRPNPKYPEGKDLDLAQGATPACKVMLPYPAKRCGLYRIHCELCDISIACTTAGRVDDPRSVTLECRFKTGEVQ